MSRKELFANRDFEHFWDPLGEKERSVGQFVLSEEVRRVHELSELRAIKWVKSAAEQ